MHPSSHIKSCAHGMPCCRRACNQILGGRWLPTPAVSPALCVSSPGPAPLSRPHSSLPHSRRAVPSRRSFTRLSFTGFIPQFTGVHTPRLGARACLHGARSHGSKQRIEGNSRIKVGSMHALGRRPFALSFSCADRQSRNTNPNPIVHLVTHLSRHRPSAHTRVARASSTWNTATMRKRRSAERAERTRA